MSFWNFQFPSPVDDILKKPSFTLQDLLDEDEVVPETRNHKQELITFLCTKENISQLITYIVIDPVGEVPTNVKFRYPVVACELLCAENNEIERVLLDNEDLLDRIFGFFEASKINLLLANLVVKVAKAITSSKMEPMLNYLKRKFHYLDGFIEHLEATAVTEFFTRLISMDGDIDGMSTQQWLTENGFVEKLISKLGVKYVEIHSDVAQSIIDIIATAPVGTPILNKFISEESVKLLFKTITDPANPRSFKYGMKVFNKLLKGVSTVQEDNPDSEDDEEKVKSAKPDPLGPLEQLPIPVQVLVEYLDKFIGFLDHPLASLKVTDQSNQSYEAFGFDRIVILDTIDILLELNYMAVNKILLNSNLFPIGLGLIFRFPVNNFCHRSLETIFVKFLENSGPDSQLAFLEKTKLAHKLLEADKHGDKPAPLYKPYLHRIIFSIGEISDKSPTLKTELDVIEGWNDLLNEVKEERKKLETASSAAKVEEEPSFFQPPSVPDPSELDGSDAYEEGRDDDDEDLNLDDDQDMDSANDADDYDADQAEILLTKQEIEASA
jgi:serine/threonine-protein phosphatase 6 regulatory subunit 3